MGPGMRPFGNKPNENRVEPPKSLRELPRFIRELLGGFFKRLAYIFKMVWETGHWIFASLLICAIFSGVVPVISSIICLEGT